MSNTIIHSTNSIITVTINNVSRLNILEIVMIIKAMTVETIRSQRFSKNLLAMARANTVNANIVKSSPSIASIEGIVRSFLHILADKSFYVCSGRLSEGFLFLKSRLYILVGGVKLDIELLVLLAVVSSRLAVSIFNGHIINSFFGIVARTI